ncbi:MAG: HesA/MoeB/ThiF family protein [Nanoarchaeota archaeon]
MRYSRQEIFIGKQAQEKLKNSTITIVGLGAIGTVSSELLVRAGIKNLILIDRDLIELTNLQRQTLFTEEHLNKPKAIIAKEVLNKINSEANINSYFDDLNYKNIDLIKSDLILDCTDNLETRFLINEFCIKNKIPWIYASAVKDSGYVFNILPDHACINCILKDSKAEETCETSGVLNTITNLIASIQVNEAIKILTNNNPEKDLIFFSINKNNISKIKVNKNPDCKVCNNQYEYLKGSKQQDIVRYCSSGTYKINGSFNYNNLREKLKKLGTKDFKTAFQFKNMTIFKNSVLIKADSEKEAKSLYSKYIGN